MKILYSSKIPTWFGADAITLYPFVCVRYAENACPRIVINHEMIHVGQIKHDGVFHFYLSYFWQYLKARMRGAPHYVAYRSISYEIEAYARQGEP